MVSQASWNKHLAWTHIEADAHDCFRSRPELQREALGIVYMMRREVKGTVEQTAKLIDWLAREPNERTSEAISIYITANRFQKGETVPLIAKDKKTANFEPVPEGQHVARCVLLVDIGTQQTPYGTKRQCVVGWELPEELQEFDKDKGMEPSMLSKFFTLSLNEKANLRAFLETWRGKSFSEVELDGFDLEQLLGVACMMQVTHKANAQGDIRAQVQAVFKLPKGADCPTQYNRSRLFTFEHSGQDEFAALPEWIQDTCKEAAEYTDWVRRINGADDQERPAPELEPSFASDDGPDDEVPF